jgi:hypothetical protein
MAMRRSQRVAREGRTTGGAAGSDESMRHGCRATAAR